MFLVKSKPVCLFVILLFSLLVATIVFGVDKRDLHPIDKANLQTNTLSSKTQDEKDARSPMWDDDHSICTGPVSGGISVDYDTTGNVYAVRCTTGSFRI